EELPGLDAVAAADGMFEDAQLLQDAQAVLPHEDPGADLAQLVAALVHGDAPPAGGEQRRGRQPGQPASGDLCMPRTHTRLGSRFRIKRLHLRRNSRTIASSRSLSCAQTRLGARYTQPYDPVK